MTGFELLILSLCCAIIGGLFYLKQENKKLLIYKTEILQAINEVKKSEDKTEEVKIMLQNSLNLFAENAGLKERQKEYYQFFGIVIQTLNEDTEFLRGNLVKGFSMDIPQVREFNSQILSFQNKILMIKEALKQQKMLEDMEEVEEKNQESI